MSKNINVPKLRFKEFCGDWNEKKIGAILTIGSGKDYKHLAKGDIPVYGTGGYMLSVSKYIYDGESVCIGRKGTIDKPMLLTGKFWTVDTLFYTHSFINSVPRFIYPVFQKINWKLYNEASGVPSLSKSTIENIKISIPEKPEQEKIAAFLTSVDNRIEQLTKKESLLQQYKKGVMQKIFSQKIRFKADDGTDFPAWQEKRLGEICEFKRGKNIPIKPNSRFFLLGMGSVDVNGKLQANNTTDNNSVLVNKNDLIMPERDIGDGLIIGRVALIDEDDLYVLGPNLLMLRINKDIDSVYLHQSINQDIVRKHIRRLVNGSAQLMITSKEVKGVMLELPCLAEQNKIAEFLSSIDNKIEQTNQQLTATKQFKKALLQQMLV